MINEQFSIDYQPLDPQSEQLDDAWKLNQLFKADLSSLARSELADLISKSAISVTALQDSKCVGFIVAFDEKSTYAGDNYQWFKSRYASFIYIDRVAVNPDYQGQSIARRLYSAVANYALESNHASICCEVNRFPPNEPSLRFHDALGFTACGSRRYATVNREVVMLIHTQPNRL